MGNKSVKVSDESWKLLDIVKNTHFLQSKDEAINFVVSKHLISLDVLDALILWKNGQSDKFIFTALDSMLKLWNINEKERLEFLLKRDGYYIGQPKKRIELEK